MDQDQSARPPVTGNHNIAAQRTAFVMAVLTLSIFITIGVWVTLLPDVPGFRVDSVTLTNFNISNSSLIITGNWDVRFTVQNPNDMTTLGYNNIEAFLFYKFENLAETTVPSFVQGTSKKTNVRATFVASATFLARHVDEINSNRADGSINFAMWIVTRLSVKSRAWPGQRRFLRVYCEDLQVGISANSSGGSLLKGSRWCSIGV